MSINSLIQDVGAVVKANPATTALGAAGVAVGAGLGTAAIIGAVKRRKTKRRKTRTSRKRNNRNKKTYKTRRRKRYYPRTAGKGKDRSHKRIRFTKNGQPYIIKGNGRALFISKRSARVSRSRKGGRY